MIVVPGAIVTPLVLDELKARKVRLVRGDAGPKVSARDNGAEVGYAQEERIRSWKRSSRRSAVTGFRWPTYVDQAARLYVQTRCLHHGPRPAGRRASAQAVANGVCQRLLLLCGDPGLVCCVANKVAGIRAVAASTAQEAARAAQPERQRVCRGHGRANVLRGPADFAERVQGDDGELSCRRCRNLAGA